jgi:hypothetical protein
VCAGEQFVGGHDLGHQTQSVGVVRVEPPAGQQHLLGDGGADQLPQPPAGPGGGQDAQARLGVAEGRRR